MSRNSRPGPGSDSVETIALLQNISSLEYFSQKDRAPGRVLEDINLVVKKGEAWGITARSLFEIKLLLEILANIKPYDGGKCVLVERGMPRNKRTILQHVFYIGNSDMLYNTMNVLEYLMFALDRKNTASRVELQEQVLEFVVAAGLGYVLLTPVKMLTKEEKAVVALMVAAQTGSLMTVFNLPEYAFDAVLVNAIARLSGFILAQGKALIIGTPDCVLIEKTCGHTAFIADGRLIYSGTVENLRVTYDKTEFILRDKDIYYLKERLAPLLPGYKLTIKDGSLFVGSRNGDAGGSAYIYGKLAEAGVIPEQIEINPKTVRNGYEELILHYDLQNELL